MPRASLFSRQTVLILGFSCLTALCVLIAAPMLTRNLKLFIGLPFAAVGLVIMSINFRWAILGILLTRALLDPILALTKRGGGAGLGALINLFLIFMVLLAAIRFPDRAKKCRFLIPWGLFLAACLPMVYFSPLRGESIRFWMTLLTYACIFLAPYLVVKDEKDRIFWMRTLVTASILPAFFALVGFVTKNRMLFSDDRVTGTFSHANILAFFVELMIVVIFVLLRTGIAQNSNRKKIFLYLHMFLLVIVLVVTETRSAWIAIAAFFFFYAWMKDKKILIFLVLAAILLAATPPVQSRLKDLNSGKTVHGGRFEKLNSYEWRIKLWNSAIPSIRSKPIFGHGLNTFQYYSKDFFYLEKKNGAPAHNVYVQTMFEAGAVGLLAYLSIFLWIIAALWRRMKRTKGPSSAEDAAGLIFVISYLIVGYSDNILYYLSYNWYFWFYIGLILVKEELQ